MNILFRDVMTVYNHYRNPTTGAESWNRTVVHGVQWSHNRLETSISGGVQTQNRVESITVDFHGAYGNLPYLPPQEYKQLPAEKCKDYWTLDAESAQDMLVFGVVEQEIGKEYRLSTLRKDNQYAVAVTAVSDNRNRPRLKTIKVVGK